MNAMATIQHVAPAHSRAAVTSAYFTACYLGLSVPVVVAGVAADRFGLGAVTYAFFAALTAFVGVLLVGSAFQERRERQKLRAILRCQRILIFQLRDKQRHESVFVYVVFGAAVGRPRSACSSQGLSQAEDL